MYPVKISVIRKAEYPDLSEKYELPQELPCSMREGDVFLSEDALCPRGMCAVAWETLAPFVRRLAEGDCGIYGKWMKNDRSALLSCNDGFRPVSFLLEAVDRAER